MKKEDAEKWLKKNIKKIQYDFGLEDWIINYSVKDLHVDDEACSAETVRVTFKYKIADIDFFIINIVNNVDLKETLRHEFYHVLLSPLSGFIEDYKQDHRFSDDAYSHAASMEELTVWNLEQHFKRIKK